MKSLKQLLESPPPTTTWTIDRSVLGALRANPKTGVHWAAEATPEGTFEVGPVGLQSVDRRKLVTVLGSIQDRLAGARRAAIVVPSAWTRSYRLEFNELPRRHAELEQVVQWRLKKLLPVPPAELRLSLAALPPTDGVRPLLAMVALERAVADLEAAFREAGVEPGLVTGRNFALSSSATGAGRHRLVAQQEPGFLSLMLRDADALRLVRTKLMAATGRIGDIVRRELGLTLGYIRETLGVAGDIELVVSTEDAELGAEVEQWRARQNGLHRVAAERPQLAEPGATERLGWARIEPAWLVMTGGIR